MLPHFSIPKAVDKSFVFFLNNGLFGKNLFQKSVLTSTSQIMFNRRPTIEHNLRTVAIAVRRVASYRYSMRELIQA
ncbi:MAG: hypothetical protein ACWM1H_09245, partial [Aerococcus sanguinicola]